jgi:NAD(P)-dependent dehydrogenase (short-subunit alcohol dehydrogenase family)
MLMLGRIDVLVNNAGIGASKTLEDSDDALLAAGRLSASWSLAVRARAARV